MEEYTPTAHPQRVTRRTPQPVSPAIYLDGAPPPANGRQTPPYKAADGARPYDADELEFLRAVDAYRRQKRRPHPTLTELLEILKGLGWGKVA